MRISRLGKSELKWMWSAHSFCRVFCPRPSSRTISHSARVLQREIILEAPGCVKMEVDTLLCSCKKRRRPLLGYFTKQDEYVNGPNGEIYKLEKANGICDEFRTLVISNRIDAPHDTSTSLLVPKLRGVGHIFEDRNAVRARARQRAARAQDYQERIVSAPATVEDSDEDSDEDAGYNSNDMGHPFMTFQITI